MLTVHVREARFLICSGDITTTQLPIKDMIEIARRKAWLPDLAIYGKIEPLHEVCPCLLVRNTFPEKRFIITGWVLLAPARRAGGWNAWSDHTHCETFCMALRRDEKDPGQTGQQEIDVWQKNRSDQNNIRRV
jgi:hypothetical protein